MSKHTPGPWIWADGYCGLFGAGPNNEVLSYAAYEGMWLSHGAKRDANARLIAAAPDLLKAAKLVLAWREAEEDHSEADAYERMNMRSESEKAIRAAIDKAEGKE